MAYDSVVNHLRYRSLRKEFLRNALILDAVNHKKIKLAWIMPRLNGVIPEAYASGSGEYFHTVDTQKGPPPTAPINLQ